MHKTKKSQNRTLKTAMCQHMNLWNITTVNKIIHRSRGIQSRIDKSVLNETQFKILKEDYEKKLTQQ